MTARAEKQSGNRLSEAIRVARETVRNNPSAESGSEFSPVLKVGQREAFRLSQVLPTRRNLRNLKLLNRSERRDFAGEIGAETDALFFPGYAILATDANSGEFETEHLRSYRSCVLRLSGVVGSH